MLRLRILIAVAALALAGSVGAADRSAVNTGFFAQGETYAAPEKSAPPSVSRAHVQTVALAGGRAAVDFKASAGSALIVWTIPVSQARPGERAAKPTVETGLRTPSGRSFRGDESDENVRRGRFEAPDLGLALPADQEAIHIRSGEPGAYQLEIAGDADAVTVVVAEPQSPLTLSTWVSPLSRRRGEPVTAFARLQDADRGVAGARVSARAASAGKAGAPVELYDDGRHGDGAAGDGLYAATLRGELGEGPVDLRFDAEGTGSGGFAFARTSSSGFVSERDLGSFAAKGVSAQVIEGRGGRVLRVQANAAIRQAGSYRLDAIVAGPQGTDGRRPGIAWGERAEQLTGGQARLSLDVPLPAGAAGPFLVDVRLLGLDPMGVADVLTLQVD